MEFNGVQRNNECSTEFRGRGTFVAITMSSQVPHKIYSLVDHNAGAVFFDQTAPPVSDEAGACGADPRRHDQHRHFGRHGVDNQSTGVEYTTTGATETWHRAK